MTPARSSSAPVARLPYPVASPLAQARSLAGPDQDERAVAVAWTLLRYAGAVLLSDALRAPLDDEVEHCVSALRAAGPATWGDLITVTAASLQRRGRPPAFVDGAARWACDAAGRRSAGLSRAVELATGQRSPLAEVEAILGSADWLLHHRLVRVLTAAPDPAGGFGGMLQPLEGPTELTEPIVAEWSAPLAVDGIYLATADFSAGLDLRPFVEVVYDPASASELCYLADSVPDLVHVSWANDASGRTRQGLVRTTRGEMAWTQWRVDVASEERLVGHAPASAGAAPAAPPARAPVATAPPPPVSATPAPAWPAPAPPASAPPSERPSGVATGTPPPADLAERPTGLMPAFRPGDERARPSSPRRISVGEGTMTRAGSSEVFRARPARGPLPDTDEVRLPTPALAPETPVAPPPPAPSRTPVASPSVVAAPVILGAAAMDLVERVLSRGASVSGELGPIWRALAPRSAPAAPPAAPPAAAPPVQVPAAPSAPVAPAPVDTRSLTDFAASVAASAAHVPAAPGPQASAPAAPPAASPLARFLASAPRAASGPLATGARIGQRYVVERSLEGGHLARMFIARDEVLSRRVLLRVPDPRFSSEASFRERFEAESRQLMRFDHPHVAKVLDIGDEGGRPFAVLQLLEGGTLEDRLKTGGLTARRVLDWLGHVADALDTVHHAGSVHRDVEPRNILFDAHDNAYLADFGVSRAIGQDWNRMTHAGVLPAAPAYMAPEAVLEVAPTAQYDQYSLAIIAFRALSGQLPHVAPSPMALLLIRPKAPARPLGTLASVPAGTSDVVARALEIRPELRYPTCAAFVRALRETYERSRRLDEPVPAPIGSTEASRPAEPVVASARPTRVDVQEAESPARAGSRAPARAVGDIDDLDDDAVTKPPPARRTPTLAVVVAVTIAALAVAVAVYFALRTR